MNMEYTIAAHKTMYKGVEFRSRLEARYAALFDLLKWKWEYEPLDLKGWTPDFRIEQPCGHSECVPCHVLLMEVKPYDDVSQFKGHPSQEVYWWGSVRLGNNPRVCEGETTHTGGMGAEYPDFFQWNDRNADIEAVWQQAGNITRYKVRN